MRGRRAVEPPLSPNGPDPIQLYICFAFWNGRSPSERMHGECPVHSRTITEAPGLTTLPRPPGFATVEPGLGPRNGGSGPPMPEGGSPASPYPAQVLAASSSLAGRGPPAVRLLFTHSGLCSPRKRLEGLCWWSWLWAGRSHPGHRQWVLQEMTPRSPTPHLETSHPLYCSTHFSPQRGPEPRVPSLFPIPYVHHCYDEHPQNNTFEKLRQGFSADPGTSSAGGGSVPAAWMGAALCCPREGSLSHFSLGIGWGLCFLTCHLGCWSPDQKPAPLKVTTAASFGFHLPESLPGMPRISDACSHGGRLPWTGTGLASIPGNTLALVHYLAQRPVDLLALGREGCSPVCVVTVQPYASPSL
ncbi:uncharacterized protein LOC122233102 [Panthera tigris]|uniref:uncharacterized protein LOC122233102 n=1 Tax=Panthera tigris TaxID=9694 RepID=UPI001C6F9D23|nr:uncharacterized protein LOC122233102 [Panthera tigris]